MFLKKCVTVFIFFLFIPHPSFANTQVNSPQKDTISNNTVNSHELSKGNTVFAQKLRGGLGIVFILGIAILFSKNRKNIYLLQVVFGLLLQITLALLILHIPIVGGVFSFIGKIFIKILESTAAGSEFLFGNLMAHQKTGYIFAFQVLPTVIFFSALMSLLFYLGVIQVIVYALAWCLSKWLRMSGQESLAVAGNIFLGQTESPLLIKKYLPKLTDSEMFVVMTSGMATIAGGVMAAYIGLLGGDNPELRLAFARHLITASVMAAPGAVVISKIMFPSGNTGKNVIKVPKHDAGKNILDAISSGAYEGLKLAANIGIMLLVFFALIYLINLGMGKFGDFFHLNSHIQHFTNGQYQALSIEFILGMLFAPFMWLMGVPAEDLSVLGRLMGEKIVFTEFVSYANLTELIKTGALQSQKSIIMATYMLCGFANFASVGILVGGIGALAPSKRHFLSKYGMHALISGTLASMLSATLIGIIL